MQPPVNVSRFLILVSLLAFTAIGQEEQKKSPSEADKKTAPEPETPSEKKPAKKKPAKRPIHPSDYARWERLSGQQFSNNGQWLVYTVKRVDDSHTLHLKNLRGRKDNPTIQYKQGERAVFSENSKWLAVTIGKSPAEIKKAKSAGKAPPSTGSKIYLRKLGTSDETTFEQVKALTFSADSRYATIEVLPKSNGGQPPKPGTPAGPGKALIVRDLASKTDTTFGNVVKYSWSRKGSLLAMVIDSPGISNALQIFDPSTGRLRTLETSEQEYASLHWRKDSMDLAATRQMKHAEKEDIAHVLLAWRALDQENPLGFSYEQVQDDTFPSEMYIAGGLSWSHDGEAVYCDLKQWEKKPKHLEEAGKAETKKEAPPKKESSQKKPAKPADAEKGKKPPTLSQDDFANKKADKKPAPPKKEEEKKEKTPEKKTLRDTLQAKSNVEVWHARDVDIMPRQKKEANARRNPKRRAAWWLEENSLVPLASELTERVLLPQRGTDAVGLDHTPHEQTAMFGPKLSDVYLIDTTTGERERILEGLNYLLNTSPDGRFVLYLRDGQVWSHEVETGEQRNLTGKLDTHFTNQEDDSLTAEKPPYGPGTWLKDGSAVLLYDRFDLWLIAPDGSRAKKLTDGAGEMIRHRLSRANFEKDDGGLINPVRPLYLALYGERTKKTGYARLLLGRGAKRPGKPEVLIWEDKQVASLIRSKNARRFAFTTETYRDSPQLLVSGPQLANPRTVARTNEFQKDFLWGRSELIDYENEHGVKLQGALTYPANYEEGKKYPMIVYIYEKRSQTLHHYTIPSEKHPYNQAVFSAEGYFVFQPDIVYRPQVPGISALECVVPAVKKVIATGMIDEKRVGLMGHSWGAYQTAFIVTRSDLFAAGVAGAPLTDLMSMSMSVYWNSGATNARIFAQSQGRMNKPFWQDVDNYVRNSPIYGLDTLNTPLLVTFGDKDGAVDWDQGIQMYNAARLAGKEDYVMLVYPGENHGLRKEENMVDYHYRIREWMDHYLKDREAPKWITEGKSFLEREREKKEKK